MYNFGGCKLGFLGLFIHMFTVCFSHVNSYIFTKLFSYKNVHVFSINSNNCSSKAQFMGL